MFNARTPQEFPCLRRLIRRPLAARILVGAGIVSLFGGCNSQDAASPTAASTPNSAPLSVPAVNLTEEDAAESPAQAIQDPHLKQTAAINLRTETEADIDAELNDLNELDEEEGTLEVKLPETGTPAWLIHQITQLRATHAGARSVPIPGQPGKFEDVKLPPEQAELERLRREEQIVELATEAIAKTHRDPQQEQIFNNAVHYLVDARMELALAGRQNQAELLTNDAEALYQRDPKSFAAVEAATKVVQYTQRQAQQHAGQHPEWARAFARQARSFAERFPAEPSRAGLNLVAAARMCDTINANDDALLTASVVEEKLPDSPFAEQVAGMLRRLRLPGHELTEFGGSTHDGGFLNISQYRGKPVLIVFWASNSATFQNDLPTIQKVLAQQAGKLECIGVNLDRDESAMDQFLVKTGLGWKQIFYSDPEQRGVKNLVARHYGLNRVPEYWVVDAQGIVRSVGSDVSAIAKLDQTLAAAASVPAN